ncbi:MAG TPA: hypothetical protein VFA04_14800 [Bryobacteraceae bacterium]|nr:hypothetical protein [Bryobacteraceae bacterium]
MPNSTAKRFAMVAGLLTAPITARMDKPHPPKQALADDRCLKLKHFFQRKKSPLASEADEFVAAADRNRLDWRLLPGIAFVESGGGKDYRNNNVFGWDNCHKAFTSVRAGIHAVAARLANSPLYRHKNTDQILGTYNPRPEYSEKVKAVMRMIAAAPVSETAAD